MAETLNPALAVGIALLAGGALGILFFGGLWWSLRRGLASPYPALWFATSLLLRLGIALGGFWWIGGSHWQRWLACLLGFMLARRLVSHLTRLPPAAPETGERPCA